MKMIDSMKYNIIDNYNGWRKAHKLLKKLDLLNSLVSTKTI